MEERYRKTMFLLHYARWELSALVAMSDKRLDALCRFYGDK